MQTREISATSFLLRRQRTCTQTLSRHVLSSPLQPSVSPITEFSLCPWTPQEPVSTGQLGVLCPHTASQEQLQTQSLSHVSIREALREAAEGLDLPVPGQGHSRSEPTSAEGLMKAGRASVSPATDSIILITACFSQQENCFGKGRE